MRNKNARVIIPLAIGLWLLGIVAVVADVPPAVKVATTAVLAVVMAVGIPAVVFYLMAEQGWTSLAKRYRSSRPFTGSWRRCATGQMAMVSVHHPDFQRTKLRLVGTLRVGTGPEGLHLSMLFSKVPILGPRFFPEVVVPWEAITKATRFEAPGWFRGRQAGALLQANYDPNYTGTFVEIETGDSTVFIQLPDDIFADDLGRLPLEAPG
ncbi:MAG: hypothetical protein WEC33_07260 [Dehalococcoidia bacterium]